MSSRLLFNRGFEKVVGLDPSIRLLRYAKSILRNVFHPVVGVAEHLPFRTGCFRGAITCFALRDVRDLGHSLSEFARAVGIDGSLAVVDVGKPDGMFRRMIVTFYVKAGMPLLARFLIRGRIGGNPFRMIIPTFRRLSTNRTLLRLIEREFGPSNLREFLFGGLIVIEADRVSV